MLRLAILAGTFLAALMIGAGTAALFWSPNAQSVVNVFGFSVTTGSVAVAIITLGAATAGFVIKKVLEVITQLARLKD